MELLPPDFLDGPEWMALRQLAFGACPGAVPAPVRQRLASLGMIAASSDRLFVTSQGFEKLSLASD